jgi:hypothetical protein
MRRCSFVRYALVVLQQNILHAIKTFSPSPSVILHNKPKRLSVTVQQPLSTHGLRLSVNLHALVGREPWVDANLPLNLTQHPENLSHRNADFETLGGTTRELVLL